MCFNCRKLMLLASLLAVAILSSCSTGDQAASSPAVPKQQKVIIIYPGPLGLYDEIIASFKESLAQELPGKSIDVSQRHASDDDTQYAALVSAAAYERPDVLAPIGTNLSQQAVKNARVATVFLGVTNPLDGVVKSLMIPELSTGVSDLVPIEKLLSLIRKATPSVKKIGVPYTANEPPAIFSVQQLEKFGPGSGFEIHARAVHGQDDLESIIRELARVNDAILVGADTKLFPAAARIAKVARQARKPFYAGDPDAVKKGAALGVTIDYREVGKAGAKLAARVLKGEKPGVIPVTLLTEGVVMINQTSLDQLHIRLGDDVRQQVKPENVFK